MHDWGLKWRWKELAACTGTERVSIQSGLRAPQAAGRIDWLLRRRMPAVEHALEGIEDLIDEEGGGSALVLARDIGWMHWVVLVLGVARFRVLVDAAEVVQALGHAQFAHQACAPVH